MDLEALALTVDELVRAPAAERGSGRLYAVRCAPDAAGDIEPQEGAGSAAARVVLELLAEGEAPPPVLGGGIALIPQRMVRFCSRRPEAPWASTRPSGSVA